MSDPAQPRLNGVVEGFYGRPWSLPQRRELFQWLEAGGLNAYLYAPKDDLKHRALWRVPYDDAETAELRELVRACQQHGLEFIYAAAPGLDIACADPAEQGALVAKLSQVRDLGVRHFAVLWDDIPAQLSPVDQRQFATAAAAQCAVTNHVLQHMGATAARARVLFCPTVYCGRMAQPSVRDSEYLREVGEKLAAEIEVLWTGPQIISETIPVASLRELRAVLRRKPVLWDNLHANDYDLRRLYLGPYAGRAPELRAEVAGILLNPNCQFEANFVPVRTLGEYLRLDPPKAPRVSYQEAIVAWRRRFAPRGRHSLTPGELEMLGDLLYLPGELGERAQGYLDDFARLLRTPPGDWGERRGRFEAASRQIVAIYDKLTELQDRALLYALYPHVWELKETALLLLAWVDWRQQHPDPGARFRSPDFRPGVFRGGFTAAIERLLPMDEHGWFTPAD